MGKTYRIGVISGDGIGPEVVREALRVLDLTAQIGDFGFDLVHYPWSSQHYIDTGEPRIDVFESPFGCQPKPRRGAMLSLAVEIDCLS